MDHKGNMFVFVATFQPTADLKYNELVMRQQIGNTNTATTSRWTCSVRDSLISLKFIHRVQKWDRLGAVSSFNYNRVREIRRSQMSSEGGNSCWTFCLASGNCPAQKLHVTGHFKSAFKIVRQRFSFCLLFFMSGEIPKCPAGDSWFVGQNVRRISKSFRVVCYKWML